MVYQKYHEVKPHYLKMVVWRILNIGLFPLLGRKSRTLLLRMFGARIGVNGRVCRTSRIYAPWNLIVGDGVVVGPRVEIYNKGIVSIGDMAIVSQDSYICTAGHDVNSRSVALVVKPVSIGAYTWLAAKSVVLPGVTIGEGGVVGCAAVVTKDVAPWTVVGGNPAKFIKRRELR